MASKTEIKALLKRRLLQLHVREPSRWPVTLILEVMQGVKHDFPFLFTIIEDHAIL